MLAWTLRLVAIAGLVALISRVSIPTSVDDAFLLSLAVGVVGCTGCYGRELVEVSAEWIGHVRSRIAQITLLTLAKGPRA
ncbi:MAG: hypothetical protein R3284_12420 [Rubricoccaceae bacterium]|nr:hypothetical protein [Rubricoccaceae bacterium]